MNKSDAITYAYGNLFKWFLCATLYRVFVQKIAGNNVPLKLYINVGRRNSDGIKNKFNKETKMSKRNWNGILVLSFILGSMLVLSASPVKDFGIIKGHVYDTQGNALAGVILTAKNVATGQSTKTISGQSGYFIFKNMAFGCYKVKAELPGTKSVVLHSELSASKGQVTLMFKLEALPMLTEKEEVLMDKAVATAVVGGIRREGKKRGNFQVSPSEVPYPASHFNQFNTEEYDRIYENIFLEALKNPLSTFSIDVDTASYANIRRFINSNQYPYKDAVRIEEMINYFSYDYPLPAKKHPFAIYTEISGCPWNPDHRLIHIGLQGKMLEAKHLPPSNLVFLLDVSGSMEPANKLPLLKKAFKLLINELNEKDRVSIAVYAGAAGLVLPSTPANQKDKIFAALDQLSAGGSTAGGAGIKLAYKVAWENFIPDGNNRIILATDGDFNIGVSSTSELVRMIEEKRKKGIFLTILGFGMGNYKDGRMEQIADKGNGNYHYIDNLLEAKKVFVNDMRGTLFTIAKDVKIQVEFNPAKVKAYRLIGYENRLLKKEDFDDDTKDAGELGAGHTVTALYEIIPYGSEEEVPVVGDLKYQMVKIDPKAYKSKEILTVKLRYKKPDGEKSQLIELPLADQGSAIVKASETFKFSAAVAEFGMLLRDSEFKGQSSYEDVLELAKQGKGPDSFGYRTEFIKLVEMCQLLDTVSSK
jgi:Ca-activated chloride channel family protein